MGESTISLSRPATTCPVDWFLKMTIKLVWCVVWYLSVAVRCDIFDVKRSHVMRGRNGSLFGFSVAQHPHWYLIGAPLDVSVESTSELTGALWKCPTSRLSQGNCTRIDIEEVVQGEDVRRAQWLGVAVHTHPSGRRTIVCAHRYMLQVDLAQGVCYTLDEKLNYENSWQPVKGRIADRYGRCQAGISGYLVDEDLAVVGAPGCHYWAGSAFIFNVSNDFLTRDHKIIERTSSHKQNDKYSYQGMSVASGDFFGRGDMLAVGAPRSGMVHLYHLARSDYPDTQVKQPSVGSQFGYSLTAADINGDGLDELIVGAPFYCENEHGGAIYIYTRTNSDEKFYEVDPITGPELSGFGMGLANLGDLNGDGCDDVAVGAPFSADGGQVHIYFGSAGGHPARIQVISGKSFGIGGSLGYSLSGGAGAGGRLLAGAPLHHSALALSPNVFIGLRISIDPDAVLDSIRPERDNCPGDITEPNYGCFKLNVSTEWEEEELAAKGAPQVAYRLTILDETRAKFRRTSPVQETSSAVTSIDYTRRSQSNQFCLATKTDWKLDKEPIPLLFEMVQVDKDHGGVFVGTMVSIGKTGLSYRTLPLKFPARMEGHCGPAPCLANISLTPSIINLPMNPHYPGVWSIVADETESVVLEVELKNSGDPAYMTTLIILTDPDIYFIREENYHECSHWTDKGGKGRTTCKAASQGLVTRGQAQLFRLKYDTRAVANLGLAKEAFLVSAATMTPVAPDHPLKQHPLALLVSRRVEYPFVRGQAVPEVVTVSGEDNRGNSGGEGSSALGHRVTFVYRVTNLAKWPLSQVSVDVGWPTYLKAATNAAPHWLLYILQNPTIEGGECDVGDGQVDPLELSAKTNLTGGGLEWPDYEDAHLPKINLTSDEISCDQAETTCILIRCRVDHIGVDQTVKLIITASLWKQTLRAIADIESLNDLRINAMATADVPLTEYDIPNNKHHQALPALLAIHFWRESTPSRKGKGVDQRWVWSLGGALIGLVIMGLIVWFCKVIGWFRRKRLPDRFDQEDPSENTPLHEPPVTEL